MTQNIRNLFISSKAFTAEGLNVQGYSIHELTRVTAKKEAFAEKCDFPIDAALLVSVIENKGKVYFYKKNKRVKALYISRKTENCISCEEAFYSPEIENEPITDLMDQQVAFLLAQRASWSADRIAVFMGTTMPKLVSRQGKYNWTLAICYAVLMGLAFSNSPNTVAGVLMGVVFGFLMGFIFREHWYEYEAVRNAPEKTSEL